MASVTAPSEGAQRPSQNWIISPAGDFLLIVAAPALALIWALSTVTTMGALAVFSIFVVFNTAHHLPTFIRIYGDKDLMQRFRWSLCLGPVVPFSIALSLIVFLLSRGLSVEHLFCLWIILVVWDPWHFIMQHYGFMRIYDRHNRAPPRLAARMDMMIAFSWFIFIMVSAGDWLPDLLYSLTTQNAIPVLNYFDTAVFSSLKSIAFAAALVATVIYVGYLLWCMQKGFFISWTKLTMVAVTFGVMYLTYVPNSAMDAIIGGLRRSWPDVPDWSFRLGFSTVGMVHVSQYLAIVWKYNRGLVQRSGGRQGVFTKLFLRGGLLIACCYVLACLLYGFVLTDHVHPYLRNTGRPLSESPVLIQGLIGVLLAGLFTSTIMHYYFDGFIWKFRHKENRQNMNLADGSDAAQTSGDSWWDKGGRLTVARTFAWQAVYFAVPMLFLVVTYCLFMSSPAATPLKSLNRVLAVPEEDRDAQNTIEAAEALATAEERLAIEQRMSQLRPRGDHYSYAFDLINKMTLVRQAYLPDRITDSEVRQSKLDALAALEMALTVGGPFDHVESDHEVTREEIEETIVAIRGGL